MNKIGRDLVMWEREIFEENNGPMYENGYCRIKIDQIYNTFKSPDIVTVIKVRRSEWLGLVVRMGAVRTVKKLLEDETGEGRKTRKTWTKVDG